jgi:hypothetical protein
MVERFPTLGEQKVNWGKILTDLEKHPIQKFFELPIKTLEFWRTRKKSKA